MAEFILTDVIWRNALAVIPLALIAALLCRFLPCRPTTRHAIWVIVLISLIVPPVLPRVTSFTRLPTYAYPLLAGAVNLTTRNVREDSPPDPARIQRGVYTSGQQPLREHVSDELSAWLSEPRFQHEIRVVEAPSRSRTQGRTSSSSSASHRPNQFNQRTNPPSTRLSDSADSWSALQVPRKLYNGGSLKPASQASAAIRFSNPVHDDPFRYAPNAGDVRPSSNLPTRAQSNDRQSNQLAVEGGKLLHERLEAESSSRPSTDPAHARQSLVIPAWIENATTTLGAWLVTLDRVRVTIAAIPPPPFAAWLLGLAILLVTLIGKSGGYRRIVRNAPAAPFDVQMLVQRIAREMDLRRVPDIRMTDACLAPMVWCGLRPRLILPRQLWAELDVLGRRTVVCHELAHLKRRDHLICRVDLFVGLLYWWHPVVWWIRRQVREQAEYCCDSWVTTLLPDGRRAYAQALLQTRTFTAGVHPAPNALALAATAPRARRFARRLAMVMTHRQRPGMTLHGVLLVSALGVIGYVAAPMVACPPDEKKQDISPEPAVSEITGAAADRAEPATAPDDEGMTTFEQFMRQQENGNAPEPDADTRDDIRSIEQRIERLQERIGELLDSIEAPMPEGGLNIEIPDIPELNLDHLYQDVLQRALEGQVVIEFDDCTPSRARRIRVHHDNCTPSRSRRVTRERDDCTPSRARRIRVREHDNCTPSRGRALSFMVSSASPGDVSVRSYALPGGKLRDLTRLMARNDVPVYINRHNDRIEVHGTPDQHRVFAAFVELINSGEVHMDPGSDVVNLAYVNAIQAQQGRGCAMENVESVEHQLHAYLEQSQIFREQSAQIRQHVEQLRQQAGQIREQSEHLRDQYLWQREELKAVESRARSLDNLAKFELMNEANVLLASAHAIQSESFRLDSQARQLEGQAVAFASQAENALEQSDRFSGLADELRDLAETYRDHQDGRAGYAGE